MAINIEDKDMIKMIIKRLQEMVEEPPAKPEETCRMIMRWKNSINDNNLISLVTQIGGKIGDKGIYVEQSLLVTIPVRDLTEFKERIASYLTLQGAYDITVDYAKEL